MDRQDRKGNAKLSNSQSPHLNELLEHKLSRRSTLKGGLGLASTTIFAGAGVSACSDSDGDSVPAELKFTNVSGSDAFDLVKVPEGYVAEILVPWGTPLAANGPNWAGDGSNSAAEQAQQVGENHDGMHYFPIDGSRNGLLVMNHEYTNGTLFAGEGRSEDADGNPTDPDEVRKDINAHGVSVLEITRADNGQVSFVQNSVFNRRITAATPMMLTGPAAGDALLQTPYDPSGMMTRGTVNNCANGHTPWGTYLTCEENIQGYFITSDENPPRETERMGIGATGFGYLWAKVAGAADEDNGEFARWDVSTSGDWANEANCFGWVVEIDPTDPNSVPKKRTAMGRMRHEGCQPGRIRSGEKVAFYMGDDARFEYFYKFVTARAYNPNGDNTDMLDEGTLYVAKYEADGTGTWMPLDVSQNAALAAEFVTQANLLVNTRSAADILGATPMDRPEWATVDPNTGEVYVTLTNNTRRNPGDENAANPRAPNTHGHIVRMAEEGGAADATRFTWDIFVFGSPASADSSFNISGLTADNEFGGPDGIWFDPRGVLWIQTDNSQPLDYGDDPSDQMLAVIPSRLPGDRTINPETQSQLKRFFVGPRGCEVTGVVMTPDYRTMMVNVQHPGGSWPANDGSTRPRSATVVIRREDGGEII
nr:PhoX family phosphatase [Oceanococcus sp. HetDA_MAG_MS8]